MENKCNPKKAYTLVELLVVMSIIGVLMALGISSMMQLRRYTDADQAVKEMVSAIKETKNRSKNNTIDSKGMDLSLLVTKTFGYFIKFDPNYVNSSTDKGQYFRSVCRKPATATWDTVTLDSTNCMNIEALKKSSFGNIGFKLETGLCDGALLENLTEKVYRVNTNTAQPLNPANCVIDVIFNDEPTNTYRKITINPATGNINVE